MSNLFLVFFLLSFVAFVVGIIKPKLVRMPSRKRSSIIFGVCMIVFLTLFGITSTSTSQNTAVKKDNVTKTVTGMVNRTPKTTTASTSTIATANINRKAVIIMTKSTNSYAALYARAKQILGTTQYADPTVGLRAFDNANSAASRFGKFRTKTCLKNLVISDEMASYNKVSHLYYSANIDLPSAFTSWDYNMKNFGEDFCKWAKDAMFWQVKTVTNAELSTDAKKIYSDIASARAGIHVLSK